MSMNYIDLVDSDSDDNDVALSKVARARRSVTNSASSDSSYNDSDDDVDFVPPLRQRVNKRRCTKRKENLKPVDDRLDHTGSSADVNNLKIPATRRVLKKVDDNIEVEESEDDNLKIPASISNSPSPSSSSRSFPPQQSRSKMDAVSSAKYLKSLVDGVKARKFPLSQIPKSEVISTGRTIKPLKAWKGHWPALREFLQNTIDHLHLMSSVTGRRQSCLDMKVTSHRDTTTTNICFTCNMEPVCKIIVSTDEITIEQMFTYPIASRALDTGVPDATKSSSNSQAGGFGDGFKTAAVALIANSKKKEFKSLKWHFYALKEKTKIEWDFVGLTRESVATFEKCQVLQVNINKRSMKATEINEIF